MRFYGNHILLVLVTFLCPLVAVAQDLSFRYVSDRNTWQKAMDLWSNAPDFSELAEDEYADLRAVTQFFETRYEAADTLKMAWFEKQKALIKKDLGLYATGSTGMNEQFAENDGATALGARVRLGVEWELMENGLGSRRQKLEKLEKEREIFALENRLEDKNRNYPYLYNNLIFAFNEAKTELLDQQIAFLQTYVGVLYDLYHNHDLSYTELIDVKTRLEEAKVLRKAFKRFNETFAKTMNNAVAGIDARQLPLVEVNLETLLNDTVFEQMQTQLIRAKQDLAALDNAAKNRSFRVGVHYNYRSNAIQNAYPSLRATVRMPLRFDRAERLEKESLEMKMIDSGADFIFYNNARELMNIYQEYNYKLKQYVAFRHKMARLNEEARLEQVLLKDEQLAHSPLPALAVKNQQLAVQMELLDLKQQLYLRLLNLYAKTYHPDFGNCLVPLELKYIDKKLSGQRLVALSKADTEVWGTDFLKAYLKKNEVAIVLLPLREAGDTNLIRTLKQADFRVFTEGFVPKPGQGLDERNFDGFFFSGIDQGKRTRFVPEKYIYSSRNSNAIRPLTRVPVENFESRTEMEHWISERANSDPSALFLLDDIGALIRMESRNLTLSGTSKTEITNTK
ncbi:MAG: hypothetical protein D6714_16045 [Bacteroidetes bacterium]|nr:MAG: hypothetical protein D6714_16045 [Bacteroidota bacterium]